MIMMRLLLFWLVLVSLQYNPTNAWEWSDWIGPSTSSSEPLTYDQVAELRVRDLKRRLARNHGYSAQELGVILDKKDLIRMLALEEDKIRQRQAHDTQRTLLWRGLVVTLLSIVITTCWPLISQAYDAISVNLIVYYDTKRHEMSRCLTLRSKRGLLGVLMMGIIDLLQLWLTASVLLSWVMRSQYFFPVPSLAVKPGQFLGNEIANSPAGQYGINVGSMAVTWVLRYTYSLIEAWTGRVLARAHQEQRKQRKAERRRVNETVSQQAVPPTQLPEGWMEPSNAVGTPTTSAFDEMD